MHNVTIDDRNTTLIAFTPPRCSGSGWTVNNNQTGYSGSYTSCTTDEGPSARIDFTGVAVYYQSPVFDGELIRFRLDGNLSETISLSSSSQNQTSRIVWGQTGLQNTDHTLEIFPGASGRTLNIDAFIYTTDNTTLSPSPSSSSSTSASPKASAAAVAQTSTQSSDTKAALALTITFGVVALIIFTAIAIALFRRTRELNERFTWDRPNPPPLRYSDPPKYQLSTQEYNRDSYHTPSYDAPVRRPKMDEEAAVPMRPLPVVPRWSFTTANDVEYEIDGSVRAWSATPSQTGLIHPVAPRSPGHGGSQAGGVSRSTTFNSKLEPVRRGTVESYPR